MKKELTVIDVCVSEDWVYIYINGRFFDDKSAFLEFEIFKLCEDFQPFAHYRHEMIENHSEDKDWTGVPNNFSDMTKFLTI